MQPGHHPELSNDAYHGGPGISKSHLDLIAKGPRAYWHAYLNPNRPERKDTKAFLIGSAAHSATLEPDMFSSEFVCLPDDAPRKPTSVQLNAKKPSPETVSAILWWENWAAELKGRRTLTAEEYSDAWSMADAVRKHPKAGAILADAIKRGGHAEQSYFAKDPETGALVKCRFDFDSPGLKLDLKTTLDASPAAFAKSVTEYRYHVQEAWYRRVWEHCPHGAGDFGEWVFIAVEKTAPWQVGLYTLPRDVVRAASVQAAQNLREIVERKASGVWPDPADAGIRELQFPAWALRQMGVNAAESDFEGLE